MTTKVELTPHDVNCVAYALDVRACAKVEGVDPEAWIKAGGPLGAAMSETGIAEDLARVDLRTVDQAGRHTPHVQETVLGVETQDMEIFLLPAGQDRPHQVCGRLR